MNLKAYSEAWARHAALHAAAQRWQRRHLLTSVQATAIGSAYPLPYYRPDWWIRLGLLATGLLAVLGIAGFLGLVSDFKMDLEVGALLLLLGLVPVLELLIIRRAHYRSGLDNALLYSALLCAAIVLHHWLIPNYSHYSSERFEAREWPWLLAMLLLGLLALLRYGDPVVAAATFVVALQLLATVLLQWSAGRLLLPFVVMAAAGALLLALRRLPGRDDFFYYRAAYLTLRTLGLAVLYLAGNYLVVREGNAELLPYRYGPSPEIPLAWVFWALTFAVPLLYLGLALRRFDRLLLWLGVLALAFSIYTFRTYHAVLPPAVAAALAGGLLLALALWALRYLRTPRHGLTAEADDEVRPPLNLESFLVLETSPDLTAPEAPAPGVEFGGGSSGGGGAEGRF